MILLVQDTTQDKTSFHKDQVWKSNRIIFRCKVICENLPHREEHPESEQKFQTPSDLQKKEAHQAENYCKKVVPHMSEEKRNDFREQNHQLVLPEIKE